jgi:hypothetical protein
MKFKAIWLIAAILLALSQSVNSADCVDCFITQLCGPFHWSKWINRDHPSGVGDWETVSDAVALGGCKSPIWIECQTTSGLSWWKTGEVIQFSTTVGCICVNANQPDKKCDFDYQIRELCPN